jgi:hypothetical protein
MLVVLPIDTAHAVRRKNPRFDPLGNFAYISEGHNRSVEASRGYDSNKLLFMKKGGGVRTFPCFQRIERKKCRNYQFTFLLWQNRRIRHVTVKNVEGN